ncbi:hypothetical protein [Shewanella algae]|uniref:hypothetical protein n=1 Tax=Shewanella algae TaxID=38313 RepID=UPI001AACE748|nr:hypothetical protein [Shewanella algae]MBO2558989.1 hypothetical protein [Shewanella algae]MBO2575857.1 hypothetical protein [Shewanella algae]
MNSITKPITEEHFTAIAKAASNDGCLKSKTGKYGKTFAVFLNGNMMLSSVPLKNGDREYFKHY